MTLVAPLSTRGHCWRCNRLTETLPGAGKGLSRSVTQLTPGYVVGYVVEGAKVTVSLSNADGSTNFQDVTTYDAWNHILNGYDDKFIEFMGLAGPSPETALENAPISAQLIADNSIFLTFSTAFTGGHVRLIAFIATPAS